MGAGGGRLRFISFFLSIALKIRQRGLVEGDDASFLAFNVSCFLHASFHALFMFRFLLSSCFVSCFLHVSFLAFFMFRFLLSSCFVSCFLHVSFLAFFMLRFLLSLCFVSFSHEA